MFIRIKNSIMLLIMLQTSFCSGLNSDADQKKLQDTGKVILITIPKSGTHLLEKCVTLLGIPGVEFNYVSKEWDEIKRIKDLTSRLPEHIKVKVEDSKQPRGLRFHVIHTPEAEQLFNEKSCANLFMMRDPRDQMVSLAYACKYNYAMRKTVKPVKEFLLDFILARKESFVPKKKQRWPLPEKQFQSFFDMPFYIGIVEFYKLFMPWAKAEKFYAVRFENLIGSSGGGSDQAQLQEIKKIAQWLGRQLTDEQAGQIALKLFGGTSTFRKGQIGSWREHFTPEVKAAFKAAPGACQLLIDLRYEKDDTW